MFIGSLNLDPRSGDINTEAGLYIESPELADQMVSYMNEGVLAQSSYRVLLNADGKLYWVSEAEGKAVRYDRDPKSTFWQRTKATLIGAGGQLRQSQRQKVVAREHRNSERSRCADKAIANKH